MLPLSSFSLLSVLSLLSLLSLSTSQALIPDTCKACSQADPNVKQEFCTAALQAAPASSCACLRGLGSISILLVGFNVTDTRCHVKQLLGINDLDPAVRGCSGCLSDCLELYDGAVSTVKKALKHYKSGQFADANIELSSIMDAATTCEQGFQDLGVVSPLTERNNNTFQLCAIALTIMSMVQNGSSTDLLLNSVF